VIIALFCEPFRPFAPSVLAERTEGYFVLPEAAMRYPGRFIPYVGDVREDKRDIITAATHVDGAGRLQSAHKALSPRHYRLIDAFGKPPGFRYF
jgi:carbamoyltransferase